MMTTMPNFISYFLSFHVFSLISIFIVSFILDICIFYLIYLGVMGKYLNILFFTNLKNKNLLMCIFPFFLYLLITTYFQLNICYLDPSNPVTVTTQIGDTEVVINGQFLDLLFDKLGSAAAFTTGSKIAYAILKNHKMGALPKIGSIGGVAFGFTAMFKIAQNQLPAANSSVQASVPAASLNVKAKVTLELTNFRNESAVASNNSLTDQQVLQNWNNTHSVSGSIQKPTIIQEDSLTSLVGTNEQTSKIIEALEKQNPNWRDSFFENNIVVNSPLENNVVISADLKNYLVELISSHLTLQLVMMYLILQLIILISGKLIMDKPNILNSLSKIRYYPLGVYIHDYLIKILKIWHASSNIWIYFILICLFMFAATTALSCYMILGNLK